MFGLFKTNKITIPLDNAQEVIELESWSIKWTSYLHDFGSYARTTEQIKAFIVEADADEFQKQLKEAAKFINTTVYTVKIKN